MEWFQTHLGCLIGAIVGSSIVARFSYWLGKKRGREEEQAHAMLKYVKGELDWKAWMKREEELRRGK